MKLLFAVYLLSINIIGYSQTQTYKCPCSKIGIDVKWADSNKVSCYLIPVSRDVKNKTAATYQLGVLLAASSAPSPASPLLYLHGGPGIATIENVPRFLKSQTWNLLRKERPLIFFDYRGTGSSEPDLCPGVADSLASLSRKDLSREKMSVYKTALYKKCRAQHLSEGIDISAFNSFQMAEDAEAIRKALVIGQWNVYGVSYGTTVALNLLRQHGKPIDAMILDSPYPPNAPWVDFVRPFDTSFKVLERKIAEDPALLAQFPSMRKDFVSAVARLNKVPLHLSNKQSSPMTTFNGDDFAWSIWSALLEPATIPFVPLAIKEVANGNDSVLTKWVAAFNDPNAFGKFSEFQSRAVLCYEGKPQTVNDSKASLLRTYPDFASFNIDFDGELCSAWQPKSATRQVFEPVVSKVPVLIFSGEYDPVCPPFFGQITSKTLSNSNFINVPAASHAAIHADDCLRKVANTFLSNPRQNVSSSCISARPKIKFLTSRLYEELLNFNKK